MIVRITGPETRNILRQIFAPSIDLKRGTRDEGRYFGELSRAGTRDEGRRAKLLSGSVAVDAELKVEAKLYLFLAPHSYTGEDVAEIHLYTNRAVTEALMSNLFNRGLRMAGPGEFTARAYLAGKINLSQAEAVNEVVISSNTFQLAAAEKLLSGQLAQATEKIQAQLLDCLSLIEAGLDFSEEDIEFISRDEAMGRLTAIKGELEQLLAGSIRYESVVDLPSVGIAGATNAGKSSLLNKLLGSERSIVSQQRKTTRDVLSGVVTLRHCRAVFFDCAGLIAESENILDELAQQAAMEALRNASLILWCVDLSKTDWSEDIALRELIDKFEMRNSKFEIPPAGPAVIPVATKSDLLAEQQLRERLTEVNKIFGCEFLPTSVVTGSGVELLRETIDQKLIELAAGTAGLPFSETKQSAVALTARHKQAVNEAIENINKSINELQAGNNEVAAMLLRAAYQVICNIEQQHLDEKILERIFSRFCIGK